MLEFELVLGPEVASGTMTLDLLYHCWGETNLESLTAHKDTSCALMPELGPTGALEAFCRVAPCWVSPLSR